MGAGPGPRARRLREELQRVVSRAAQCWGEGGTEMEFGLSVALAAYRLGFARGKKLGVRQGEDTAWLDEVRRRDGKAPLEERCGAGRR